MTTRGDFLRVQSIRCETGGCAAFAAKGLAGRPKTAICCVSEKIQTAYVCAIHRAPWIFSLPCISPFLN